MKTIKLLSSMLFVAAMATSTVSFGQVKIGDNPTTINPGSVLEMESANKGLLLPRVSLSNTTTWGLAGTAVAGMNVYNTNNALTSSNSLYPTAAAKVGQYYWDGTGWVGIGGDQSTEIALYVTGSQVVVPGPEQRVNYTSAKYDKNSNFNLATDQIIVPSSGYYLIVFQGISGSAPIYVNYGKIYHNGAEVDHWDSGIYYSPSVFSGRCTQILKLNAGDTIHTTSSNLQNNTSVQFQLMITKLSS